MKIVKVTKKHGTGAYHVTFEVTQEEYYAKISKQPELDKSLDELEKVVMAYKTAPWPPTIVSPLEDDMMPFATHSSSTKIG